MSRGWLLFFLWFSLSAGSSLAGPSSQGRSKTQEILPPFGGTLPANAQRDSLDVRMIGRWSYGPSYAVAADPARDVTYLGSGQGIFVLESLLGYVMSKMGEFQTRDFVAGLAYHNDHLYVANGESRLTVYSVTDPQNPVEVGHYDSPGGESGVYVSGGTAYVACSYPSSGLRVVSVKDPENPEEIGFYDTRDDARAVTVDGAYVYLSLWDEGLLILEFYGATGIGGEDPGGADLPKSFSLQNFPNPFNPSTLMGYSIPQGPESRVSLSIYDVHGKLVRKLVDDVQPSGRYTVSWDGKDSRGSSVASGIYFYRLQAGGFSSMKKLLLVR